MEKQIPHKQERKKERMWLYYYEAEETLRQKLLQDTRKI